MALKVRRIDYFYTTVKDTPGEAYKLLAKLAASEIDLLAFGITPDAGGYTSLTLFPESVDELARLAAGGGLTLVGPQRAFLIQGDDELGALVEIHRALGDAQINIYAGNGVTDGAGSFGYVLYVKPEDYEQAARILRV